MRLLLVEDSARLQKIVAMGLKRSGYAVDISGDGRDALWKAKSNDYDVIILDIMIPEMDGLTVLHELRQLKKDVHVLLLTAKDSVEDRVRGLRSGADDYLVKPFAFEELLARVETLCRRRYEKKQSWTTIENLRIDFASRRILSHDREIDLMPREFKLLEYLLRRRGEVLSRSDIESRLYDDLTEVMSNVVDSTICQIRKKLPLDSGRPLIETKRGLGYFISEEPS